MEYAQLNEAQTEAIQVTTHGNVQWDENNFCSAAALVKDGKADQFRVVPLLVTEPPAFDPMTQSVIRDGCELVDGQWQYRWRIDALSAEQIAANQAAAAQALQAAIVAATQAHLDAFAQTRNYDGILSACTYASSAIPQFAVDGQAAVNARDATWAALYQIMGEVQTGTRPVPTGFADIEADLPTLVWPA